MLDQENREASFLHSFGCKTDEKQRLVTDLSSERPIFVEFGSANTNESRDRETSCAEFTLEAVTFALVRPKEC